ncbi:MAG: lysophospholipid acyltransferase family protein [bacterium]|nr:lysophospholipid acyltransferase family protein [bacterium]
MSDPQPAAKECPQGHRPHRPWRKRRKRFFRAIGTPIVKHLGPLLMKVYSKTWRYSVTADDPEHLKALRDSGGLAILWHGRGFSLIPLFRGMNASILVSHSRDGQIMGDMLNGFGFETIQGSSSKGGARAMREMIRVLKTGRTICFTPDGPQGPQHFMSPAVAFISRSTGFPVIPVGLGVDRAWHANNWDSYTVPKPFAKVVGHIGPPIQVPRELSDEEQGEWSERIRQALLDAETRAFEKVGAEPDW